VITRTPLEYTHGDTRLHGLLVHDDARQGPLPGALVFHEFMGPGGYMLPHAELLARHGYAALLCDMYGDGLRPTNKQEASAQARIYRTDRQLMRERAMAGFRALARNGLADAERMVAVGFSFGGCAALELARSGAELRATASFYGYLNTPLPCAADTVKGRILVLHGAHDKVVPMAEIDVFEEEMREAGVECRVEVYPDAGHGFANANQPGDPATGSRYCEKTCRQAWETTLDYFRLST
jgi:dienelactone hydrolase